MIFIDLFSGIGGFRLGMESAGHKCIGHVEIDKFASESYRAIFGKDDLIGSDITKITDDEWILYREKVDCICGGFPCQAFSIAGHRRGFEDTRGTLFFEILRAAKAIQPSYLFLENVKGLLSHDKGKTFKTMLCAMDELGYDAEWKVLNSKNFGVPQHRERVFIIGHLRGQCTRKIFSFRESDKKDFGLQKQGVITNTLTRQYPKNQATGSWIVKNKQHEKIIQRPRGFNKGGEFEIAPTLSKSKWEHNNLLEKDFRIRKLTPRECWRLQGFPDWAFDRARKVNSDSQLYKQAGNSVTVNVIKFIAERLEIEEE